MEFSFKIEQFFKRKFFEFYEHALCLCYGNVSALCQMQDYNTKEQEEYRQNSESRNITNTFYGNHLLTLSVVIVHNLFEELY